MHHTEIPIYGRIAVSTLVLVFAISCSSNAREVQNDASVVNDAKTIDAEPLAATLVVEVDLLRSDEINEAFIVEVILKDSSGESVTGDVAVTSSAGTVGAVSQSTTGSYRIPVLASSATTGEYSVEVMVEALGESYQWKETALHLATVNERWGVPRAVRGAVNTRGWEDGASITPDGQWLFVQYLPTSPSCLLEGDDDACDVASGPWDAPLRPNMPGAERISSTGEITQACPAFGLDAVTAETLGLKLPPNAVYGFRRQADGSFAQPFVLSFSNVSGCMYFGGVSALVNSDGTGKIALFFDDPTDFNNNDTLQDIAMFDTPLGSDINLGTFVFSGDLSTSSFTSLALNYLGGAPEMGVQSNPHLVTNSSGDVVQVWADRDDPSVMGLDLYFHQLDVGGSFPAGPMSLAANLPAPINSAGEEIQPFFNGTEAFWTGDLAIHSSQFLGADLSDIGTSDSWAQPTVELAGDQSQPNVVGTILAIGEPTLASFESGQELYFIYAIRREGGKLDLDVGVVRSAP